MDSLWKFVEDNNLSLDTSNLNQNILCGICSNIMKQSVATRCGCLFCNDCIKTFLGDEKKHCPDCVKENIISELSYYEDIIECRRTNKEIARSSVKCPQSGCEVNCELQSLLEHLSSCKMRKEGCILRNIGCMSSNMNDTMMDKHLREELKLHFQLIADNFSVLRNGLVAARVENSELRGEATVLRADNSRMQEMIEQTSNKMAQAIAKIEVIEQDMKRNKEETLEEILKLSQENAKLKRQLIRDDGKEFEGFKMEIAEVKSKNELLKKAMQTAQTEKSQEIGKVEKDNADLKMELNTIKVDNIAVDLLDALQEQLQREEHGRDSEAARMAQIEKSVTYLERKTEPLIGAVLGQGSTSQLGLVSAEGLHWTPTLLSRHHGEWRYSHSFTVRCYKMRLGMMWWNDNSISTYIKLVQSMNDARALWPMCLRLRLRLTDPDTGKEIHSQLINCDCSRPQQETVHIDGSGSGHIKVGCHGGVSNMDSVEITVQIA